MGRARSTPVIAVDTSAIVAIVLDEAERPAFRAAITAATKALISTVSVVEAKMVVHGHRGPRAVVLVNDLYQPAEPLTLVETVVRLVCY